MPAYDQTPFVTFTDSTETLMEVSGGVLVPNGTKGFLATGIQTNGSASFFKLTSDGTAFVTGSVGITTIVTGVSAMIDGFKTTYSANANAIASAATATDLFLLQGSSTKTIRLLKVEFYGTQTTAGTGSIFLLKRSSANSGGTSTTPTIVAYDSTSVSASAVVRAYTVNPTTGSLVGALCSSRRLIPTATGLVDSPLIKWDFGDKPGSAVVLRGTAESVAINLNGVTFTGGTWSVNFEWTEE